MVTVVTQALRKCATLDFIGAALVGGTLQRVFPLYAALQSSECEPLHHETMVIGLAHTLRQCATVAFTGTALVGDSLQRVFPLYAALQRSPERLLPMGEAAAAERMSVPRRMRQRSSLCSRERDGLPP